MLDKIGTNDGKVDNVFNIITIAESIRRRWIAIAVVTAVCVGLGVFSAYGSSNKDQAAKRYTAEAVLYVQAYGYGDEMREGGAYNYSMNEGYMVADARKVVISNEVAGTVRRMYPDDNVTVSVPRWYIKDTKTEIDSRFIFINVSASNAGVAVEAADKAADLAVRYIGDTLPVESVSVSEQAYLRSGDGSHAGDLGVESLTSVEEEESEPTAMEIRQPLDLKKVFIYGFVGLVLSVAVFAAYDILSRRVRSPHDVERLLDIPVLETVRSENDIIWLSNDVRAIMEQNGFAKLAVVGATEEDGASAVAAKLSNMLLSLKIDSVVLDADTNGVSRVRESQAALIALKSSASKGSSIEKMLWRLKVADVPVVGSVFLAKR